MPRRPTFRSSMAGAIMCLVATASLSACGTDGQPEAATLVVPTVTGGQLDFGDYEGQDMVLWFWAPW